MNEQISPEPLKELDKKQLTALKVNLQYYLYNCSSARSALNYCRLYNHVFDGNVPAGILNLRIPELNDAIKNNK